MSKIAAALYSSGNQPARPVIIRYCGLTASSCDAPSLVRSVCYQILCTLGVAISMYTVPTMYSKAVALLHRLLRDNPVILIIVGLDYLSEDSEKGKTDLSFLRGIRPHTDTRILVSTRASADMKSSSFPLFHDYDVTCFHMNEVISNGYTICSSVGGAHSIEIIHEIIRNTLHVYSRTITPQQFAYLSDMVTTDAPPSILYLRLACVIATLWRSYDRVPGSHSMFHLKAGVDGIVSQILTLVVNQCTGNPPSEVIPGSTEVGELQDAAGGGRSSRREQEQIMPGVCHATYDRTSMIKDVFGLLSIISNGITETELLDILVLRQTESYRDDQMEGQGLSALRSFVSRLWLKLRASLFGFLLEEREEGLYGWRFHGIPCHVLKTMTDKDIRSLHRTVGLYFGGLLDRDKVNSYHCMFHSLLVQAESIRHINFEYANFNKRRCLLSVTHLMQSNMNLEAAVEICNIEFLFACSCLGLNYHCLTHMLKLSKQPLLATQYDRLMSYLEWMRSYGVCLGEFCSTKKLKLLLEFKTTNRVIEKDINGFLSEHVSMNTSS